MTERDPLEEYIQSNREAFDNLEAPDRVWNNINSKVNATPKVRSLRIFMTAAAACLLLLAACLFFINKNTGDLNLQMAANEVNEELPEMKKYFSRQVSEKVNALKGYDLDGTIEKDLEQSDDFLEELEQELKEVPPSKREAVMEAMIKNYQYKLMLLDRVINELNKSKNQRDENSINI